MDDRNNAEIMKIIENEIRMTQSETGNSNIKHTFGNDTMGVARNESGAQSVKIFLEELEKRKTGTISKGSVSSSEIQDLADDGSGVPEKQNEDEVQEEEKKPPIDPRDGSAGPDEFSSQYSDLDRSQDTDMKEVKDVMKKSIRISHADDMVKVRFLIGQEEFGSMSVKNGSGNAISFGGTKIFIDGNETILEV